MVRLEDAKSQTSVSIMPSRGNSAFQMKVKGKDVLRFPYASIEEYLKGARGMSGIPFLGPWANRLDETAFYANGKKYPFNMELGNVRPGQNNHPIHGFLTNASQWQVVEAKSDRNAAWVTSRLEFYRQPEWMAQFPFAHTIEMTYRLQDGALEVLTKLEQPQHRADAGGDRVPSLFPGERRAARRMDVRHRRALRVAARRRTKFRPARSARSSSCCRSRRAARSRGSNLDHVFGDLVRDASGRATMWVQGQIGAHRRGVRAEL